MRPVFMYQSLSPAPACCCCSGSRSICSPLLVSHSSFRPAPTATLLLLRRLRLPWMMLLVMGPRKLRTGPTKPCAGGAAERRSRPAAMVVTAATEEADGASGRRRREDAEGRLLALPALWRGAVLAMAAAA